MKIKENKLIIASAGSGKTAYIIDKATEIKNENVLITTYTIENEKNIKQKIIKKLGYIPSNIVIKTWLSFLLNYGVKPYKNVFFKELFNKHLKGILFTNGRSGIYHNEKSGKCYSIKGSDLSYYFNDYKIYSDKISEFTYKCNEASNGKVIKRLSDIFQYIFIDEIQDLTGYDFDVIELFCNNENINLLMVGDLRQTTYKTHNSRKKCDNIEEFINQNENKFLYPCLIDKTTLKNSHRNSKVICDFSSFIYKHKENISVEPCNCCDCIKNHKKFDCNNILLVKSSNINEFLLETCSVQILYNRTHLKKTNQNYKTINAGESKGEEFDNVMIYFTKDITEAIKSNNFSEVNNDTLSKFYVAITRAKYTVAIVYDYKDDEVFENKLFKKYK